MQSVTGVLNRDQDIVQELIKAFQEPSVPENVTGGGGGYYKGPPGALVDSTPFSTSADSILRLPSCTWRPSLPFFIVLTGVGRWCCWISMMHIYMC